MLARRLRCGRAGSVHKNYQRPDPGRRRCPRRPRLRWRCSALPGSRCHLGSARRLCCGRAGSVDKNYPRPGPGRRRYLHRPRPRCGFPGLWGRPRPAGNWRCCYCGRSPRRPTSPRPGLGRHRHPNRPSHPGSWREPPPRHKSTHRPRCGRCDQGHLQSRAVPGRNHHPCPNRSNRPHRYGGSLRFPNPGPGRRCHCCGTRGSFGRCSQRPGPGCRRYRSRPRPLARFFGSGARSRPGSGCHCC